MVSPGEAASTASWIDCPGVTLNEAAGATVGVHTTAKPKTDTAPMLNLPCFIHILSCGLESVLSVAIAMPSAPQRASHAPRPSHRCESAAWCLTKVDIRGGTCMMCARDFRPRTSHFPCTAGNDGSVFVSPPRNDGSIFPGRGPAGCHR